MIMIKESVVTSVQGNGTWDSTHGTFYKWEVAFQNGDVGEYLSKTNPQTKFNIGQPSFYEYTSREFNGNTFYKVKPAQDPTQAQPSAPSKGSNKDVDWDAKDRRIVRQNALSHATSLVCADKISIKEILDTAKRFEDWVYRTENNFRTNETPKAPTQPTSQTDGLGVAAPQPPLDAFAPQEDDFPF